MLVLRYHSVIGLDISGLHPRSSDLEGTPHRWPFLSRIDAAMQSVVPAKFRHDKQLVSHDTHTTVYNYKYTFSVEIVPICKEDLICLPPKVSQQYGQIGPLLLCTKVRTP